MTGISSVHARGERVRNVKRIKELENNGGEISLEFLEGLGWVAAGFFPTLLLLHIGYSIRIRRVKSAESQISSVG